MQTPIETQSPTGPASARIWAAVTIRAAWELQASGIRVTRRVLAEAREHVLLSLPEHIEDVEFLTTWYVREYVERLRHRRYQYPAPPEDLLRLRPVWRQQLLNSLDPVGTVVWRLVYDEGLSLAQVEARCRVDQAVLLGVREGVRSAFQAVLKAHRIPPLSDTERLDRALRRLAQMPAPDCDGGVGAAAMDRDHLSACPRCTRLIRLARSGILPQDELSPAEPWAPQQVSCLALHLHPDGRQHRAQLVTTFGEGAIRADADAVLVDLERVSNHVTVLSALAEEATPPRDHLRGALIEGQARWAGSLLLGPAPRLSLEQTRERTWGEIDTVGSLPEPLPPPPSAARWWAAALVAFLAAVLAGAGTLRAAEPGPRFPIDAEFAAEAGESSARFDVNDRAMLLAVVDGPRGLEVLHADLSPADKGALSTGEGDYILSGEGHRLLLASAPAPLVDTGDLIARAGTSGRPLESLAQRLREDYGHEIDVKLQPLPER